MVLNFLNLKRKERSSDLRDENPDQWKIFLRDNKGESHVFLFLPKPLYNRNHLHTSWLHTVVLDNEGLFTDISGLLAFNFTFKVILLPDWSSDCLCVSARLWSYLSKFFNGEEWWSSLHFINWLICLFQCPAWYGAQHIMAYKTLDSNNTGWPHYKS